MLLLYPSNTIYVQLQIWIYNEWIITLLSQLPAIRNICGIVGGLNCKQETESSGGLVTSKSLGWTFWACCVGLIEELIDIFWGTAPKDDEVPNPVVAPPPNMIKSSDNLIEVKLSNFWLDLQYIKSKIFIFHIK